MPQSTRREILQLSGAIGAAAAFTTALSACSKTAEEAEETKAAETTAEETKAAETTQAPAEPGDGMIKAAISYELGTNGYDPMTTTSALTIAMNWHTMEGLTEIHPATREVFAALGADLPKQVDDTTWEVALREGAVFTDGTPVTTEDVVYSFERVMNPDNNSLYVNFIPFIDKVEAKDDSTVTIKLKYPFSLVAERLSVVKIVPKAAVEADPKAFDLMPIGTGPYKMTDNSVSSQKVVLERNDAYTGKHPAKVATIEVEVIPDDSTRTNALTSGSVQAIDSVPAANLASLAETKQVAAKQGFGLVFVMFNNGPESPMKELKNRQAVMYALDHAKISSVGMSDLATPATCFVQEDHPAYKKAATVYTFDLEKAKALLAETGLKKVRLLATNHGFFSGVRPIVKESLEAAGLEVVYDEKKSADCYGAIKDDNNIFDVFLAPGDPSVFGDDADLLLRWWYAGEVWPKDRYQWHGSDAYKKCQELLDKASQSTGDEQKQAWHDAFDLISNEIPLYPLFHRKTPTAFDGETLDNFMPIAVTGLSFVDVGSKM